MGIAGTGIIERWGSHRWLWLAIPVLVRVAVALVLIVGPTTDEPAELAGWDAERFQEIAERDGPAWVDHPVEYPPGSVVVFDRLVGDDVVETHRRLVGMSVLLDLGVALALSLSLSVARASAVRERPGGGAATAYLWLGLPLIPFGYQRLDTLVTTIAVAGGLALLIGTGNRRSSPTARLAADGVAATAIAVGAMIKVWPLLLVVGAVAIGRWRAAGGALVLTGFCVGGWLLATGEGLTPVDQVLSLRGATGWHVESLPGALVALVGSDRAELELNAYRIGTLRPGVVTAGRALAVATMGLLALAGRRRRAIAQTTTHRTAATAPGGEPTVFALVVLGSLAALLVTAPLLSPQFLVWLVPWAALAWLGGRPGLDRMPINARSAVEAEPTVDARPAVALTAAAGVLTGLALHGFGPAGLDAPVPAVLLNTRNLALVGTVVACLAALGRVAPRR